ncbi:hypothetical protein Nepgr_014817 [Nepenthes gracilis]|uniref:Uncharacterized protein n=1 Tax=Nepenthes gracilis TaxID=150966 RepID=A0AAD3XQQ5_NEPGR|nr:hypothetical protein Nepgr_014817 [Nepenthes gracilis]
MESYCLFFEGLFAVLYGLQTAHTAPSWVPDVQFLVAVSSYLLIEDERKVFLNRPMVGFKILGPMFGLALDCGDDADPFYGCWCLAEDILSLMS